MSSAQKPGDAPENSGTRLEATASGHSQVIQAAGNLHFLNVSMSRGVRNAVFITMALAVLIGGGWVGWKWVRPMFAPAYKTQFLIDATAAAGGPEAIAASLSKAVGNAGEDDVLSLRAFGGQCGTDDATTQLVGFGTGNRQQITHAATKVSPTGEATLLRGIVEAVNDFSKTLAWGADQRATQVNRIIVVTRHGADACDDDSAFVQREIQERIKAAGLKVDFKVVGYQVPHAQRTRLEQIAAGVQAGDPVFADDPAKLNAALEWLTNTQPVLREAKQVIDVLNPAVSQVEAARTAIDEGRFDSAERHLDRAGSVNVTGPLDGLESRAKTAQARDTYVKARQLRAQQRRVVASGRDLLEAARAGRSHESELAAYRTAVTTYNARANALTDALNTLRAAAPGGRS
ncbi:hypothetical protein [Actinomadura formosensis]|uniref:hypothetical protein n=1 Tax=Actinomadura formosensis TaxID=60706 RepID=UPI003D8CB549